MSTQAETAQVFDKNKLHYQTGILLLLWLLSTMSLWAFAFYEVPTDAPDWVRRAQIACFGSDDSGLPGSAGWMLLILSPALFLFAIYIGLTDEVWDCLKNLKNRKNSNLLLAIIIFPVLAEAVWVANRIQLRLEATSVIENSGSQFLPDYYPVSNADAPDFSLINHEETRQSLSELRGNFVFLSFIFAHCKAVCPTLIKTISKASEQYGSDKLKIVFITLDPWRDTPASLSGLIKQWNLGSNSILFSGDPAEVNAALDAYKVPRERDSKNGDVLHPSIVHVISPQGKLAYSFNKPSVQWLTDSLKRLENNEGIR